MVEGVDAKVYFVNYSREMEEARSRGELLTNSFVRFRKQSVGRALIDVDDLGDAEGLLSNPLYLGEAARKLLKRGIIPTEDGWGGWLGRYQAAICNASGEIEERKKRAVVPGRRRGRDRSPGR